MNSKEMKIVEEMDTFGLQLLELNDKRTYYCKDNELKMELVGLILTEELDRRMTRSNISKIRAHNNRI